MGVGRSNKAELIPCTISNMNKYKISQDVIEQVKAMWDRHKQIELSKQTKDMLRPYQLDDCAFLVSRKSCACFNEQRTGKTPTAIRAFEEKGITSKVLVVCPASAVFQWAEEYERWSGRKPVVIQGTVEQRAKRIQEWIDAEGIAIISYDTLKPTKAKARLNDIDYIEQVGLNGIIVDEAHRLRHLDTAQSKAVMRFKNVENKLVLTGTPAPSCPQDIFGILAFLYPNMFTSYWRFVEYFFGTDYEWIPTPRGMKQIKVPGKGTAESRAELVSFLSHMSTQRKRKDVLPWLPDKDYEEVKLPLSKEQKKYIEDLEQWFETEDLTTSCVLDRLTRIRQICASPELVGLKGKSPKMEWLKQFLKDNPDTPVIIFSKFTSFLKSISKELDLPHLIIGETSKVDRNRNKTMFQEGKINQLLINIDAGKEALTLDRAEVAIFLDKYPPAGDILQAEDRFVATTEDRKDKPHTIIEVMMKDSYDETIYQMIRKGINVTELINNYKSYLEKEVRTNGK